jgi:hypothetical protein
MNLSRGRFEDRLLLGDCTLQALGGKFLERPLNKFSMTAVNGESPSYSSA